MANDGYFGAWVVLSLVSILAGCGGGGSQGPGAMTGGMAATSSGGASAGSASKGGSATTGGSGAGGGGGMPSAGHAMVGGAGATAAGAGGGVSSGGVSPAATVCGAAIPNIPTGLPSDVPSIILDTDMGPDCDDAGALAVLHALVDNGEANLLGVVVSSTDGKGKAAPALGFIDAVNTYYGRPDIPIGLWKGENAFLFQANYTGPVSADPAKYPHDLSNDPDGVPDATCLYRAILAAQPDHSVTIVNIGFMNNLVNLLQSAAGKDSDLSGAALVEKKVAQLVQMGGQYPSGREFNFYSQPNDKATARVAVESWPKAVPMTFTGYELGVHLLTGTGLKDVPDSHPAQFAYQVVAGAVGAAHSSWDLTAVLFGVRGASTYWDLESAGSNKVDMDGTNTWVATPDLEQAYLKQKADDSVVAGVLDQLMAQAPKK